MKLWHAGMALGGTLVIVNERATQAIREAMRAAEACSTEECKVDIKLIAAPLYVLTTITHNKKEGIDALARAVDAAAAAISKPEFKGELVAKDKPRCVTGAVGGCGPQLRSPVRPHERARSISDPGCRRVVSAEDDRLLAEKMAELELANQEVDGDASNSDEGEEEGMAFNENADKIE